MKSNRRTNKFWKGNWWKVDLENDKYRVVNDLQGGEFGMGRDYTIEQWILQAMEWCYQDDNEEEFEYYSKAPATLETLHEIGEMWTIVFRKVRKDKKYRGAENE